ncbi:hypothetical protein [Streptomyces sp. NPDC058045]|uniref:hypothetical protein n=1 Tax=Streptomyces sp. NPDC058045 TaxID=3346311 RepID=UPI0036E0F4D9
MALIIRAVPGPEFVPGCTVRTWLDVTPVGPMAHILIGHRPPRRPRETAKGIEASLMGMVDGMRLRPSAERLSSVGAHLLIRSPHVALDYGHPQYLMGLAATTPEWRSHIASGWPTCVTIGLDPIPPGAGPDALDQYVERILATNRAHMGVTTVRNG